MVPDPCVRVCNFRDIRNHIIIMQSIDVLGGNYSFLITCRIRLITKRVYIFLEFSNIDNWSGATTIP